MASNITQEKSLTSKEIALYVGIPIASLCIAGGIYYYYTKKSVKLEQFPDNQNASEYILVPNENESSTEIAASEKSKGNKYFKAGRYEQAIECYTKALKHCPEDNLIDISTFYQNRAAAHEQLKHWSDVVADCSQAIQLNPKYTKALGRRARAYEALDEKRNCLEDVTAVCLLEGFQNQQCMLLADRILKSIGKELAAKHFESRPRVLPSSFFVKSYLDSFNSDIFYVEIPEDMQEFTSYHKIIEAMKQKEYTKIVEKCTEEIEKDGKYKNRAYLLRGTMYTLMCNIPNALADLNKVIELEENETNNELKINALIKRGSLKMQEAKDLECYADFDLALKISNKNANIFHHRGQLYFLTERLDEAKKEFETAISLDPKFVAPRLQLGYCVCKLAMQAMSMSMMNEANKILEETTKLFPQCAEAWSLYGQLLQDQQRLDEALEKLEKAISIAPDNPTTYIYKGLLMLQWKQDVDEANRLIRKAIEIDDKCDFAYETLATLEVQKGNNEEAVRLFERAITLVRSESEMANTFSLLEAAKAQAKVTKEYGVTLPPMPM